ncbi:MAG TPA: bifunctional phosphoribosyl-AMP cyclohydrolase/phosphoribosyl-ATP diphosphatase HisIE [Candidatus Limnocylindrales bacterium]|nr:bifunctional phosphoribosyl-AMP cyclohydrolase/phosphoribosyl-ATP diphosphatase HisIE [Candidatus Limnocylindrales bacterium]
MADQRGVSSAADLRPVIVQDVADGRVLMLAWANDAALEASRRTGEAHFWSRSRAELWHKGATSGNRLPIVDIATDCDGDALLYRVSPLGPACHTGARSCFDAESPETEERAAATMSLERLEAIVERRADAPASESYTARLLSSGPGRPARKVVEEAAEVATAALAQDADRLAAEAADLLFHLLVTLRSRQVRLADVLAVLAARHRPAG